MRLFADYHTHTVHSHGKGRIIDNALAARERGLDEVGIADHGPASLFGVGVKSYEALMDIRMEAQRVSGLLGGIRVLASVEANLISLDGELDVPRSIQPQLDILQCGVHHMSSPSGLRSTAELFFGNWLAKVSKPMARRMRNLNTKALVEAINTNPIDVITHPGLQVPIDTLELARACVRRGTALEINTSHRNVGVEYIRAARKVGARFSIGSDAHTPSRVGDLSHGIGLAMRAGLEAKDIINAVPDS